MNPQDRRQQIIMKNSFPINNFEDLNDQVGKMD